jgi:glycosyltransferase involved in cell wall biosynthesis
MYPKISIITPNYNGAQFLEETILSVIGQNYPNLEYIIADGGSTDGSVEIIKKYETKLKCWISEPDKGLYYALQKGFDKSTGEIMGWINSDDKLIGNSLFILSDIFNQNKSINWLQGYPTVIDEKSRIVFHRPHAFKREYFLCKSYKSGSFIQQESTFWRRSLWVKAGTKISTEYKYAGDFELWIRFFNYDRLYITTAIIGSFRVRTAGQISQVYYKEYLAECNEITDKDYQKLSLLSRVRINCLRIITDFKRRNYLKRIINLLRNRKKSQQIEYNFPKAKFLIK